jgi:Ca2+-binding EF-hand superfamily protein
MASKSSAGGGAGKGKDKTLNDKFDKFRAIIRKVAADLSKSINAFMHGMFDEQATQENGVAMVSAELFKSEMMKLKEVRAEFSSNDIDDIFNECDEAAHRKMSIDELATVCTRTVSKARADAMKLRIAIMEVAKDETEYRREFSSIVVSNSKFAELEGFADYAEEMLNKNISDADVLEIMTLFDMDGDGKVSCEDFVGFILGRTSEAVNVLKAGDGEHIVDIRISSSGAQEAELSKNGYQQLVAEKGAAMFGAAGGTFGKGESLWIWRRKQGTASGRLKPIVDMQLNGQAQSSSMVLGGYLRVQGTIAGK